MKPALEAIRRNIEQHGVHLYVISGGASPRFLYTIGLTETLGHELVFAGGACTAAAEVKAIVVGIVARLREGHARGAPFDAGPLGAVHLREACEPWTRTLMLGAYDYYRDRAIAAYQIVPDEEHRTIDVPDLSVPWSAATEPVWRWQFEPWPFPIPRSSIAATNGDALRGRRVTRAARWEEDLWEVFTRDDVDKADLCPVPLGVLLGADPTLRAVVDLKVGEGIVRDDDALGWRAWD